MIVLGRVVFIAGLVALGGAVALAGPESEQGAIERPTIIAGVGSPYLRVSDSRPGEAENSGQKLVGGDKALEGAPRPPELTHQQKLDDLFARLAASTDAAETNGLTLAIDRLQLESGSNTGDYLMARAIAAIEAHNFDVSLALLDKIIILQPGWAEAWNKRATARYLLGDDEGSMADIAHVLVLEPRHFGALSGMGMILERRGLREEALRAYQRALDVAPQLPSLRSTVERLKAAVAGQDL